MSDLTLKFQGKRRKQTSAQRLIQALQNGYRLQKVLRLIILSAFTAMRQVHCLQTARKRIFTQIRVNRNRLRHLSTTTSARIWERLTEELRKIRRFTF